MLERTRSWIEELKKGSEPVVLFLLTTDAGQRVYGKEMPDSGMVGTAIDWDSGVVSFGKVRNTLTPVRGNIFQSLKQSEMPSASVGLSNVEKKLSKVAATESMLSATGEIVTTFKGLTTDDFLQSFDGRVHKFVITEKMFTFYVRGE